MSLRLNQYHEYWNIGEEIDYLEIRLGENLVIPFEIKTNDGVIVDLTNWVFSVSTEVYSATCEYSSDGTMRKIYDIQPQLPVTTNPLLTVVDVIPPLGTGTLLVPADVNPDPNKLIFPDTANTMMNLITITCTFPSASIFLQNTKKILIGLIVRLG